MLLTPSASMNPLPFSIIPKKKPTMARLYSAPNRSFGPSRVSCLPRGSFYMTGNSSPEIPTVPPGNKPAVPMEIPRRPNVPDFDPIPPEKPADPPPLSPGPIPEFPGPPDPVPPKPEGPRPPIPSPPGEPEIVPPHGPDVIPPKPPEPGPPHPTQPDIPPPLMGSDGLVFY